MRTVIIIIGLLISASCSDINKVRVKGTLNNCKGQTLVFEEVDVFKIHSVDSLKVKGNGRFSFSAQTKIPQFYQLRTDNRIISLLLEPGEKAVISGDMDNIRNTLIIEGSEGSLLINELINKLNDAKLKLDSLTNIYNNTTDEQDRAELEENYEKIIDAHRRYSIEFVLNNYKSLASIMAVYQEIQPQIYLFNRARDIQFYKIVRDSLKKRYPKSNHIIVLNKYTNKLLNDYQTQKIFSIVKPSDVGLPDIALPDVKGDTIKLSSLKGKYVLLSFWASWNEKSVEANLKLKDIYKRYKNRGFEIYQVSFDKSVSHWIGAVNFDELPWLSVNDSTYPNSMVAVHYNVQALPSNYLLDKDMVNIVDKNINANTLNNRLSELLN